MHRVLRAAPSIALGLALAAACARPAPADLILTGGRVVTLDDSRPEAEALAVRGDRIVALGTSAEIARLRGPATEVIDLAGALAIPGFIEGHGHFTGLGRSLMKVDLRSARTWDEVVERVAAAAAGRPAGEWILGWGWHQEKWDHPPEPAVEGYPVHDALSRAVADHPVLLKHAAGSHAGIANARAMELAGITAATPDPPGGTILRDAAGRPTGVLRETAYQLVLAAEEAAEAARTPERIEAEAQREIELASRECLAKGVTSFQDAGASFETVGRLRAAASSGTLGVRVWVMLDEPNEALEALGEALRPERDPAGLVSVGAIKRLVDGALGTHGAWLLEPYADLPESSGLNTYPIDDLERTVRIALAHDLQLCVHAIGDRANRETLDLYERALGSAPHGRERRWRIEHAQHLHPDDVPRFGRLGVIASMQAVHCTSDGPWIATRLGSERAAERSYLWRSLLDAGAVVVEGTDTPVEDVDPVANFHAAVTRRLPDGRTLTPEQRMTRLEALRAATSSAAWAAFEEDDKGTLAPGKLADVVVLSGDILEVPDDEILQSRVLYTLVGGRVAWRHEPARSDG